MKFQLLLVACLIALSGCAQSGMENASSPTATATASQSKPSAPAPTATPQASKNQTISALGIGDAKLGMTLGQLKQTLKGKAEFNAQPNFIVDFGAIAVSVGGKVQYYILHPAGKSLKDSDAIEFLLTDNSNYQTDKGVGPGTPLKEAAKVYGDATLSYNLATEGREFVSFAKHPAKNISFRLGAAGNGSLAGIYPKSNEEFHQTRQYRENAQIRAVLVDCRGQKCPTP